jgi:acyl carrier protein
MGEDLSGQVRQFIASFWYQDADKLRLSTRLEEDLGITGLDASEFLGEFARVFDVDLSDLEFHKHFGPECGGPILLCPKDLREGMKDLGKYPVTIDHLINVARAKRLSHKSNNRGVTAVVMA